MQHLKKVYSYIKKTPQGFFAFVGFVFGIIFLLIVPPLQTPDEGLHFVRAYRVSELNLIPDKNGEKVGDYLPTALTDSYEALLSGNNINVKFNSEMKFELRNVKHALGIRDDGSEEFIEAPNADYSILGYIPQAIGVAIARLFDMPIVAMIYIARLFNLLAWIGIGYLAIKMIPARKWAIAWIALLPMMVAQSVSVGTDVVSIGAGLLFIAAVLSAWRDKTVSNKKIAIITVAAIFMVASKLIMVAFLPLVILLYKKRYKARSLWIMATVVIAPFIIMILHNILFGNQGTSGALIMNGESPSDQISYLISHPWQIFVILYNTFFLEWGNGAIESVIGNFGWVDTPLSSIFIVFGYIALAFVLCASYAKKEANILQPVKKLFLLLAIGYAIAVCIAMYVFYSPIGYPIVVGIQGRYFIPALFLLAIALVTTRLTVSEEYFIKFVKVSSMILLIASGLTIVMRYYVDYL